ncbi:MAG: HEAT repeat domain-containing protein [Anaerolineae bacterium]
MPSSAFYRQELAQADDLDAYLHEHSALPGPRANLELVHAVADWGDETLFLRFVSEPVPGEDANDPATFRVMCGTVGLGRLLAEGSDDHWERLRLLASDPRWRVREAVAMALQRAGQTRFEALIAQTRPWRTGCALEQRALIAGLCEPALLAEPAQAAEVLFALDEVTSSLAAREDRNAEDVRVLRQALGYCWSVAIVASPEPGWSRFGRWAAQDDPDVRWIVRENLRKKRLQRLDPGRVAALLEASGGGRA